MPYRSAGWNGIGKEWGWACKNSIDLNPNHANAHAYYSNFLFVLKRTVEAMTEIEKALELDPYNSLIQSLYAIDLYWADRCDELFDLTVKNIYDNVLTRNALRFCYLKEGMIDLFMEELIAITLEKKDTVIYDILVRKQSEGGYKEILNKAAEIMEARAKNTYIHPTRINQLYAAAENKEKTLEQLEKGLQNRAPGMPYLTILPIFDFLRNEPRFKAILREMNLEKL